MSLDDVILTICALILGGLFVCILVRPDKILQEMREEQEFESFIERIREQTPEQKDDPNG